MSDPMMEYIGKAQQEASVISDIAADVINRPIEKVAIIGAGTMGGGIAMSFANVGIPVIILDIKQDYLDAGLKTITRNYASSVKRGKLSQEDMDARLALISMTTEYDDLSDVDLAIEAVFENMDIKEQVFNNLDRVCKKSAILASNTSTLDMNVIAEFTSRPEDVVGLHFFSPANIMKLLEIVRGDKTADDVLSTVMALARKIHKIGVISGVCYGFIGNRMLEGYMREAAYLLLEGATPSQVDNALQEFGMAMGIFNVFDVAGIDVTYKIRQGLRDTAFWKEDERYGLIPDTLHLAGRDGMKVGKGFYDYEKGSRTPIPSEEVHKIIEEQATRLNIPQKSHTDQEIIERCIFPLINEGAKILEEKIAARAGDLDIVYLYGYGFPAERGGPMKYAAEVGLSYICERLEQFEKDDPFGHLYWKPAKLLKQLAVEGVSFT